MKYVIRLFEIAISAFASYKVFWAFYMEYYRYLPDINFLTQLNTSPTMTSLLRENSNALRELYNRAFEMSLLYSVITFLIVMILLNYIRFGNLFTLFLGSFYNDIKEIRQMNSK